MAANEKLLKVQQLQRTQELIRDINFDNAISLPSAVGAENIRNIPSSSRHSNSWLINRYQDSIQKNDMTLIGSSLRDITDILNYRQKISGEKNPLYNFFENLRNKAERGEHVDWQEFTNAINTFSADKDNLTALQDEINNTDLAAENEKADAGEGEESLEDRPSAIVDFPKEAEELPLPEENYGADSNQQTTITPPRPRPVQEQQIKKSGKTPEQQKGLKEKMEKSQNLPAEQVKKNALPERKNTPISSKTRKKAIPRTARVATGTTRMGAATPGSGGLLGGLNNYLLARDLANLARWAANKLGLQGLGNLIGKFFAPERWLGQLARSAWNLGASLGKELLGQSLRTGLGALANAGQALSGWLSTAGTFLAGGGGALLAGALAVVLGGLALFLIQQNELFSDCGKPGAVSINKSAKNVTVKQGEEIEFELLIFYRKNCAADQIENVEVRDTIPQGAKFVENSDSATSAELVDPLANSDPLDDLQIDNAFPATIDLPRDNPNDVTATGLKPKLENNTLIWKIGSLSPNIPVVLSFKVKAPASDTWIVNQATVTYTETNSGANNNAGASYPVTQDNCNGKYRLNNPLGNFGDIPCDFEKNDLYSLLKQQDSTNADLWFYTIVRCESSYNPNSWRDPNITPKTPDPAGAWGLFQMGRGRNGPNDRGDVPWRQQTSNAVAYSKNISSLGAYWAAARPGNCID